MRGFLAASAMSCILPSVAFGGQDDARAHLQRRQAAAIYAAGLRFMQQEAFEKAEGAFRTAVRLDADFVLAHYGLGQVSMVLKRYANAVEAYVACREVILKQRALERRDRGEAALAREDQIRQIQELLRLWQTRGGPGRVEAILRLEENLRFLEQQRLKDVPADRSVPPQLSLALGSAYFRLGRLEDAEREYLAAVAGDEPTGAAHNNLAVIYLETDRHEQARKAIELAERSGFIVDARLRAEISQSLER